MPIKVRDTILYRNISTVKEHSVNIRTCKDILQNLRHAEGRFSSTFSNNSELNLKSLLQGCSFPP